MEAHTFSTNQYKTQRATSYSRTTNCFLYILNYLTISCKLQRCHNNVFIVLQVTLAKHLYRRICSDELIYLSDGDSPSMDIVFILDTSNSVTQRDLEKQKEFVKLMAQRFDVSPFASHAAVLSYGDKTILIGGLYDHVRGKRFEDNVDSVTLIGGKRNIQEALKEATNHLAIFGRQNASNVVFLITYGRQSPELGSQRLQEIVQNVRDTNAILYVIGVGVDADDQQLGLIVESTTDFFEIPRSGDLKLNVPSIVSYTVSRAGKFQQDGLL